MRRWLNIASNVFPLLRYRQVLGIKPPPPLHLSREGIWRKTEGLTSRTDGKGEITPADDLPPWPVDEIEFNTRAPMGGHDIRRAHEQQAAVLTGIDEDSGNLPSVSSTTHLSCLQPQRLTEEQKSEVRRVESTTEEGAGALEAGGWVCGSCLHCMPYRSRSVCDSCHTVRHDAATAVARWRGNPTTWFCSRCHEFNFERDAVCRCCNLAREAQTELHVAQHERVADEIQRSPVGSVIVTRNRVARWRCFVCSESNALQSSICRNCETGRFDLSVSCWNCGGQQKLSNSQLYGSEPADRIHVARPFGLHNCFPRLAPEQRCNRCRVPLHGATASTRSDAWLCGCGVVCNASLVSCTRCRIPRRFAHQSTLEELVRVWDFASATNWFCESCNHVNKSSRHVVALDRSCKNNSKSCPNGGTNLGTSGSFTDASVAKDASVKFARISHGTAKCERCGQKWHHQPVNDGQYWRCACHKVNKREDTRCQVCFLPAADGIRSDVLSFWSRGDWYCFNCQRQNYREKVVCACGEERPVDSRVDNKVAPAK
ncbi:uncharacterized protein TEOVI_000130300 [Trypanosoma equiperdum]|uniref:RanBP2-type domain-containing protein n=4 Tax=Trypanozoon TaxID=39700 RepID=Q38CA6_TRYB2|nr:hypothetical protein, conserved [Trypanosoma brucei gambiense DAL972]XP_822392.1 hypothetical protein, conserved [Trypanosoma brucei brucei TREU927]RHW69357.1 hypothetical protein DPX39_100018200 [Trypanosoma brucei equiperdum]SCU69734.1 hypothetical protein, conserved [Trypanosoma equiperdum]EAN77564.1 hypothetical protein, conserved [Trypanosoma brucei brucei TREU927]CBH15073.1 hypothetical protein, conserved [Trypanosoma brucei gambiense DAL972]|eukprot:XP_011777339.1 hypothetical protein, conserved [Trypanosoma brucei gambiense DAL972]